MYFYIFFPEIFLHILYNIIVFNIRLLYIYNLIIVKYIKFILIMIY